MNRKKFTAFIQQSKVKQCSLIAMIVLTCVLFLGLRMYRLSETLDFFGDVGRDFMVLQHWFITYKPPLLGPQTSVISFNQSAFYFYLLFPFFVISGKSLLSTTFAVVGTYSIVFIIGLWLTHRYKSEFMYRYVFIWLLMSIHPQFVLQHREVWNPSFAFPFLLLPTLLISVLKEIPEKYKIPFFTFSLSIAVSLTYSVIPTAVTLLCLLVWQSKSRVKSIAMQILSGLIINLPTILFELKHQFPLTKTLFSQEMLTQSSDKIMKINLLNIFMFTNESVKLVLLSVIIISACIYVYFYKIKKSLLYSHEFFVLICIFLFSVLFTILAPISMQAHYVFGIITILFVLISVLPRYMMIVIAAVCIFYWLQPSQLQHYLNMPSISVAEKVSCTQKICNELGKPLFVNVNSSSHNHQGFEYIYLLKEAGCQSYSAFDYSPEKTKTMVVISEKQEYVIGKTDYYEISRFAPKKLESVITCSENLSGYVLSN